MSEEGNAQPAAQELNAGIQTPEGVQSTQTNGVSWPPTGFEDNEILKNYRGPEDAYKALVEKEKFIRSTPRYPGQDAKPEDKEKFFSQIRPEKPDDYQVELVIPSEEGDPKPFELNEQQQEIVNQYKQLAHKYGITQDQFSGFMQELFQSDMSRMQETEKAEVDRLKSEYKSKYDQMIAEGNLAYKNLSEPAQEAINKLSVYDRYKVLNEFSSASSEDQIPQDGKQATQKGSLEDLGKAIDELNKRMLGENPTEKLQTRRELQDLYVQRAKLKGQTRNA